MKNLKPEEIPEKNREKAHKMLLEHFGGEFPEYFINDIDQEWYTHMLAEFLTEADKGDITWSEFDSLRQQVLGNIEMSKETSRSLHNFRYRKMKRPDDIIDSDRTVH